MHSMFTLDNSSAADFILSLSLRRFCFGICRGQMTGPFLYSHPSNEYDTRARAMDIVSLLHFC